MLLLADSGSTKTDWALIEPGQGLIKRIPTIGFNPYFIDSESIYQALEDTLLTEMDISQVEHVHFYGAGCSTEAKKLIVFKALNRAFPLAVSIQVGHDLLASARALLGKEKGFAAILGTGANTCIYDGNDCVQNIDSLGYLLGDEGSGSYIGKKFVRDFMRRQLEPELQQRFQEKFQIESNEQIFQTLYTTQFPNRFLAGFCRFAEDFPDHPYVKNKVSDAFRDFFKNLVSRYPDYDQYTFNCIGSVGFVYRDILMKTAEAYHMKVGRILASPMEDLIQYHLKY